MGKEKMLNSPNFLEGGKVVLPQTKKGLRDLYGALQRHFEREDMKKSKTKARDVYEDEPYREPKRTHRAMGGALATIKPNMVPQKPKKFVSMLNRGINKKHQF
jgi:hypothetical protein